MNTKKQKDIIQSYVLACKKENKTVLITKGVFDIIHPDHIKMLNRLSKLADVLIVLLIPDWAVSVMKPNRPILEESARLAVVGSLKPVTKSFIDYDSRDSDTNKYSRDIDVEIMKSISPDMWAMNKGQLAKFEKYNIGNTKLVAFDEGNEYSTTKIIDKILVKYSK